MTDAHRAFERACLNALGFLCDRFGFAAPELEQLGREGYVRFHKGARTVSIAWEPGTAPIVELFFPTEGTGERPVPWAARNGTPYSRRIPHLKVADALGESGKRRRKQTWHEPDQAMMERYLAAVGRALEITESDFLSEAP